MKTFQEFILEASCNSSPKGMDCPTHGKEKCPKVKSHKTVEEIAKKHRMKVSDIQKQLDMGIPIEHEHTKNKTLATDIALQHLEEIPDYYSRLKKMEASAKKEHKKFKDVKEATDGCRKVGAANWGTKSESTGALDYDWNTPIYGGEERYCPKCKKMEHMHVCKYGPEFWRAYSFAIEPHDHTKETIHNIFSSHMKEKYNYKKIKNLKNIQEIYTRIQSRGSTYSILLNWRGKYISAQMFFPQFSRPPKDQVTFEVRKIYPGAIVLSYNPATKDPTKPLIFTGNENGSK